VADDERTCLVYATSILEQAGFECDCAADALTAVGLLRTQPYDLLISDIQMPGNENLRLIREVPQIRQGLPVIIITGHPTLDTALQSIQLSVACYLTKPAHSAELVREAQNAIQRYRTYRTIYGSTERLVEWRRQLEQIQTMLASRPGEPPGKSLESFANMTLQNILGALVDLKRFSLASTQGSPSLKHLEAISETIDLLEQTRCSFKAVEFAELHQKLGGLLDACAQAEHRPPPGEPALA
jgi:CheY-like chemotaxis protein